MPHPPSKLGPYRLVRELARGGTRGIHEGVHVETGQRDAILALDPAAAAGEHDCFCREARLLAQLDHPHVVRVHALSLDRPRPYVVEDLLTGGDLLSRITRGPFPLREAVTLMIKLARGLEHAHRQGVVHRDLRPQNVLFDRAGEPRLVDFGLVLCADASRELAASGTILGTPLYAAPEHARPGSLLDTRTDVYGLGALLYALLTGRPPLAAGETRAATLEVVANATPPPPASLRAEIPAPLSAVCLRALDPSPCERFPSAEALACALEAAST